MDFIRMKVKPRFTAIWDTWLVAVDADTNHTGPTIDEIERESKALKKQLQLKVDDREGKLTNKQIDEKLAEFKTAKVAAMQAIAGFVSVADDLTYSVGENGGVFSKNAARKVVAEFLETVPHRNPRVVAYQTLVSMRELQGAFSQLNEDHENYVEELREIAAKAAEDAFYAQLVHHLDS